MKKSSMKSIVVASTLVPSLLLHSIPPAFASDTNDVADNTNSLLTQTLVDEQFEEQVKADQEYHKQVYEQLLNESREAERDFQYQEKFLNEQNQSNVSQESVLNSSFGLEKNKDLFLALHNVGVQFAAQKSNGTWNIIATVNDVYNFEYWNYTSSNGLNNAFVTMVNNYAADSQRLGAIVPYSIAFYIQSSFH